MSHVSKVYGNEDTPFSTEVARGAIEGSRGFRAFGERRSATAVTDGNDVYEGAPIEIAIPDQTTGVQVSVVSTSVDDAIAGTHVQKVHINYIDLAGDQQIEIFDMDGQTPVNSIATDIRFINEFHSVQVDGSIVADGNITVYLSGSPLVVYSQISAGGNHALNTAKMVPAGKRLYVSLFSASATSGKPVSVRLRTTSDHEGIITPGLFYLYKDSVFLQNSNIVKNTLVPFFVPALAIIKITAYSTQAGGQISAGWEGWIEDI